MSAPLAPAWHPTGTCPHASDGKPAIVTCGTCQRRWCEACDPAPAALCHWCHGRGYSLAPVDRVTTWADGYGVWHATVTDGPGAGRRARAAIMAELRDRAPTGARILLRVERRGYASGSLATRVEYREERPDVKAYACEAWL